MHQIITRNSKNDSSPICRYREEGAQVADMGSTENKRAKSFKEKKKKKANVVVVVAAFGLFQREKDCFWWRGQAQTLLFPTIPFHPPSLPPSRLLFFLSQSVFGLLHTPNFINQSPDLDFLSITPLYHSCSSPLLLFTFLKSFQKN